MLSPFPGMDPYLEARWSDVHLSLIGAIRESLQIQLPDALRARAEEDVYLEEGDETVHYRGDIAIVGEGAPIGGNAGSSASAVVTEPLTLEIVHEPVTERWVQIIDRKNGNRVVTVIEVLSPTNKEAGAKSQKYCKKVEDFVRGGASLVEIDLIRSHDRKHLLFSQNDLPRIRRTPYLYSIRRAWKPNSWKVYPLGLRQPIPALPVPLREGEPEIMLDLQPLIEHAYRAGRHDDIDYTKPPDPALEGEDAAWANELLKSAGKR